MNIADLLTRLSELGIRVRVEGDSLKLAGPTTALTPELIAQVRTHKPEILAELTRTHQAHDQTHDHHDHDRMARAFQAAALPIEMPRNPDQARDRLHRLLEHVAPRPEGLPSGVDLVALMGGRRPGPRLVCSYEPWAFGPGAVPLRWRLAGDPGAVWQALGINTDHRGGKTQ